MPMVRTWTERSRSADPIGDENRLHDDLMTEYFKLVDLVRDVDQRLLTIKGWGVTLGLARLGSASSRTPTACSSSPR